jgi:hypothetical protein
LIAEAPTVAEDNTAKMQALGGWREQTTLAKADVEMFSAWKPTILEFVGAQYEQMTPISYSSQLVNGTNYKITFNVSAPGQADKYQHLLVVVNKPFDSSNAVPTVLSAVLPSGEK